MKRQIILDITHDEYHAATGRPYLTAHLLQKFINGGIDAYRQQIENPEPPGPAKQFGTAFHLRMEDEARFRQTYTIGGPVNPKTGATYGRKSKKFTEWEDGQSGPCLTAEEAQLLEAMAVALAENVSAGQLMQSGCAEVCLRGEMFGLPCQSLIDWVQLIDGKPGSIVDLKTCADINAFEDDIKSWQYDIQMAFYRLLMREVREINCPIFLIAVDKQPTPVSLTVHLTNNDLYEAEQKVVVAISQLKRALAQETIHA